MELTIQLDSERAKKLAYLQTHRNQNPSILLAQAIDKTYQELSTEPKKSAYQIFEEAGLIGCMDGTETLPETDYPSIREHLQEKRRQGRL